MPSQPPGSITSAAEDVRPCRNSRERQDDGEPPGLLPQNPEQERRKGAWSSCSQAGQKKTTATRAPSRQDIAGDARPRREEPAGGVRAYRRSGRSRSQTKQQRARQPEREETGTGTEVAPVVLDLEGLVDDEHAKEERADQEMRSTVSCVWCLPPRIETRHPRGGVPGSRARARLLTIETIRSFAARSGSPGTWRVIHAMISGPAPTPHPL